MWWGALIHHDHSASLWGPPLWIPYLFLPLGMTLLVMQYIVYIGRKIKKLRQDPMEARASSSAHAGRQTQDDTDALE
jgi:TRAP-type C4-dicarboxylate transport system permease small subunit